MVSSSSSSTRAPPSSSLRQQASHPSQKHHSSPYQHRQQPHPLQQQPQQPYRYPASPPESRSLHSRSYSASMPTAESPVMIKQKLHQQQQHYPVQQQQQQTHAPGSSRPRPHKQQSSQQQQHGDHEPQHAHHARSHTSSHSQIKDPHPHSTPGAGTHHPHQGSGNVHESPAQCFRPSHSRGISQSQSFDHHQRHPSQQPRQGYGMVTQQEALEYPGHSSSLVAHHPHPSQSSAHARPHARPHGHSSDHRSSKGHPPPSGHHYAHRSHDAGTSGAHSIFSAPAPLHPQSHGHAGGPIRPQASHHSHPYHVPQQSHSRTHSRTPSQQFHSRSHSQSGPHAYQHSPHESTYPGHSAPSRIYAVEQLHPYEGYASGHSAASEHERLSSHTMRSQTLVPQAMVIDDDEEEEDDGEIKQDTRTRRSVSVSGAEGSAKKQNQQPQSSLDQDHSDVHKCMDCGKVYKHPNCLWKHRWLHSVYWKGATKFLLSKHQQVQLMEAAAILLGMDESREGDKDPIVSMFSKQRGAMANSVGSSVSGTSSSSSPPTSTKSLSASPPPASERMRQGHGSTRTDAAKTKVDPPHNSDIQMLTALRHSHGHASGPSPPSRVSSSTAAVSSTKSARAAKDSPKAVTTSPLPSPIHSKSATSSSSSTPPTLTADDESLPEMDGRWLR
ncbi:unnamed protein product [Mortierella alpina]